MLRRFRWRSGGIRLARRNHRRGRRDGPPSIRVQAPLPRPQVAHDLLQYPAGTVHLADGVALLLAYRLGERFKLRVVRAVFHFAVPQDDSCISLPHAVRTTTIWFSVSFSCSLYFLFLEGRLNPDRFYTVTL